MLYNFNSYYINLSELISLTCEKQNDSTFPFILRAHMRNGDNYGTAYITEAARNTEAWNIMQAHNRMLPAPVSRYEVESIVSSEMEKVRRDFRRLREAIREGHKNGE